MCTSMTNNDGGPPTTKDATELQVVQKELVHFPKLEALIYELHVQFSSIINT